MTSHVSSQDDAQEAQPKGLEFVLSKFLQKVVSCLVQNSERLSSVHVLVDGLITVAYSHLRHRVYMEGISESVVTVVVTDRRNHGHEGINIRHLSY